MPIIPLLKKPGPLADAAAPVLDNQRRPTVDRRAEMGAAVNLGQSFRRPEVNPDALTADTRSLGAVGESIARTGSVLGAVALKRREAETDIQISEADNALSAAFGEHASWRASNPDPSGWEENLNQTMTKARAAIDANEKLHPEARRQISLRANKFINDSRINTAQDAAQQTFRLAASTFRGSVVRSFGEKNYEQGIATAKEAEAKGYLFPHEVAGYEADVVRYKEQDEREARQNENLLKAQQFTVAQNLAVSRAANQGEESALKDLDDGKFGSNLSPTDKERVRNSIQAVSRDRAAQAMDSISAGIVTGEINSEALIDAKASPHFGPKLQYEAKEFLKRFDASKQRLEKQENGIRNAVEMRQAVMDYDPAADKDRTEYFKLSTAIKSTVEEENAGELLKDLAKKYGTEPPKVKVRPEVKQGVTRSINALYDPEVGAIKWRSKNYNAAEGRVITVIDQAKRQQAIDAAARLEIQMNDWFQSNPDKVGDYKAAREKLEQIIPSGTRPAALEALKLLKPAAQSNNLRGFVEPADFKNKLPAGLKAHAQDFIDAARETGLNPRVLAAISALETGGGTSKAFKEKLNAMGISNSSGPVAMSSVRESIFRQARTLAKADGPYAKAKTLDEIGAVYAPDGAENDFNGTNAGWSENVRAWLSRL